MSRREKVLEFLEAGPFQGSVNDLADEIDDRSPSALSAAVSVLVKEKLVRRWPDSPGAVSEWLWLPSHATPEGLIVDVEIVDELPPDERSVDHVLADQYAENLDEIETRPKTPAPARRCVNDRDPDVEPVLYAFEGPITVHVPDAFEVIDERPPAPATPVMPEGDGPSPMAITLDVSPWQIRINGCAITNREARALIRDLRMALSVVDFPSVP